MLLIGHEYLVSLADKPCFSAKMVFNNRGAIIFPASQQHRDRKAEGITYEDDYKGNALAAMLSPCKIEIRFHRDFSDREVARLIRELVSEPPLRHLASWETTYQGRRLKIDQPPPAN